MRKIRRVTQEEAENIRHLYFDEQKSMYMISQLLHRDFKTLEFWIRKFGKPRTWSEAQILANKLGRGQGKKNFRQSGNWKGGRTQRKEGYIMVIISPDSPFITMGRQLSHRSGIYINEHRLIMAQHLNRCLSDDEIVHHLNGIRSDNRLKNLALLHRSNHPTKTFMKLLQKHIRELEAELSQQKLI